MEIITKATKVWYLENTNLSSSYIANKRFTIELQKKLRIKDYLEVYNKVGRIWGWSSRLVVEREKLINILQDNKNEIYYCYYDGEFAGYLELDLHSTEIEIVYFGLIQRYIGLGLGRQLMQYAFLRAIQNGAKRLWLHTCEFDSPQAIPFYKKMGFLVFDEKIEDQKCVITN